MTDANVASNDVICLVNNVYAPQLRDSPFRVLHVIYMRTIAFNKACEVISIKQFCEGAFSRAGRLVTAGCQKKASAVREALTCLENLGFIKREPVSGNSSRYSINTDNMEALIKPFRPSRQQSDPSGNPEAPLQNSGPPPLQNSGPPTETSNIKTSIINNRALCAGAGDGDSEPLEMVHPNVDKCRGVVDSTKASTNEARQIQKAKGGPRALEKVWQDALREHFPGIPHLAWRGRQLGNVAHMVRDLKEHDPARFLESTVERWDSIMRAKFPAIQSRPMAPSIDFVFRFLGGFVEDYAVQTGGLTSKPIANVRMDRAAQAEIAELERQLAAVKAEKNEAVEQSAAARTARHLQLGREAQQAPQPAPLRRLKPTSRPKTPNPLPDWE